MTGRTIWDTAPGPTASARKQLSSLRDSLEKEVEEAIEEIEEQV